MTTPEPPGSRRYRISRARKVRKWLVAAFGRRRRAGSIGETRAKKYARPSALERLLIWRMARAHMSARSIGRSLGRDHHTVMRHAALGRLHDLAGALALAGYYPEARSLLKQHGEPQDPMARLIAELEDLARWRRPVPPFPL
jgi:hypothetical protein